MNSSELRSDKGPNCFVIFCLLATLVIEGIMYLLDVFNIFIVDLTIFNEATVVLFISAFIIIGISIALGLDNAKTKYVLLSGTVVVYAILSIYLAFNMILSLSLPLIYASQYKQHRIIWLVYFQLVVTCILIVPLNLKLGIYDANSFLIATGRAAELRKDITELINNNLQVSLTKQIIFCGIPKALSLLCFVPVIIHVSNLLDKTSRNVTQLQHEQKQVQFGLLDILGNMIGSRDTTTGIHVFNAKKYVAWIVNKLQEQKKFSDTLTEDYAADVIKYAALHDVGKLAVPDAILTKPGKFTPEERFEMEKHTAEGERLLRENLPKALGEDKDSIKIACQMALYHHMWYNDTAGKSYPRTALCEGNDIPLCARIMSVGDVLDALLSQRQYKPAFSIDKTYQIMKEGRNTQFDAEILDVVLDNWDEFLTAFNIENSTQEAQ